MSEKNNGEIIIYRSPQGNTRIDVRLQDETVWLTQKQIAELFQTTPQNITIHLKNIFEEGELQEDATCKDFLQVQREIGRNYTYADGTRAKTIRSSNVYYADKHYLLFLPIYKYLLSLIKQQTDYDCKHNT